MVVQVRARSDCFQVVLLPKTKHCRYDSESRSSCPLDVALSAGVEAAAANVGCPHG